MKVVGNSVYVHKYYARNLPKHAHALFNIAINMLWEQVDENYEYDYVKWGKDTGMFTFVRCEGWNTLDEPICRMAATVNPVRGTVKVRRYVNNPPIIHGKHLFVKPNYRGFSYDDAQARWNSYQDQPWLDKHRMGFLDWWTREAIPRLKQKEAVA